LRGAYDEAKGAPLTCNLDGMLDCFASLAMTIASSFLSFIAQGGWTFFSTQRHKVKTQCSRTKTTNYVILSLCSLLFLGALVFEKLHAQKNKELTFNI
jgi:hypothetical protein